MATTKTIRVSDDVYEAIQIARNAGEIPDDVLRRLLRLPSITRNRKASKRQRLILNQTRLQVRYLRGESWSFQLPIKKDDVFQNWHVREQVKKWCRKSGASEGQLKAIECWFAKHGFFTRKARLTK